MPAHRLHRLSALLPIAALAVLGASPVSADGVADPGGDRIRITGRVVDRSGAPLSGARVIALGWREVGVVVGASGRYTLDVPGGSIEEIERRPLLIRVQARRAGHRLTLRGGSPELAIEMRVTGDATAGKRFQVRSNDAAVASSLADAVVLENGTRVSLKLDFVGARGTPIESDEVDMAELEEVILSLPRPAAPGSTAGAASRPPAAAPGPPPAEGSGPLPPPAAAPVAAPSGADAPAAEEAERGAGRPTIHERLFESRPRATTAEPARPAARGSSSPGSEPPPVEPRSAAVVRPGEPEAVETLEEMTRPRVIRPGAPEAEAAEIEKRKRKRPRARAATVEEMRRALDALGERDLPVPPAATPGGARATGAGPSTPSAAAAPAPPAAAGTAVPPAAAGSPAPEHPAESAGERLAASSGKDCACRIQGTVEVVSEKPLPTRMQVVVYLEDDRKVADMVELFMGSPRQFDLQGVRCGPHRLKVRVHAKQRFVLVSPDPVVDCAAGGYRQIKLVLEPIQRWRSAMR